MLIITIIFMFAVSIVVGLYLFYSQENVLNSAIYTYEQGEYEKAIDMFKNYLSAKPGNVKARNYLAEIYIERNEPVDALKQLISITVNKYATFREKADAYAKMAEIYTIQEMYDKAAKVCINGYKLEPKNKNIHYNLGFIYKKTEKINRAIKEFNLVLSVDRTHIPSRMRLAEIHQKEGDFVKSIFQYRRITEIDPKNDEARFQLARLFYEKGELDSSARELEKMKDISGKEIDYYYMLTEYYQKTKKFEKHKEALEKIVLSNETENERLTYMRYKLAIIYHEEGKLKEAYDLYFKIKEHTKRYKDVEKRVQKIKKVLYPEEYAKIIDSIDYNNYSNREFEDFFYKLIDKLGYKEIKGVQNNRNKITVVGVEKFKNMLQGTFLLEIIRSFDIVNEGEVYKFDDRMKDEKVSRGVLITTSTFSEDAIKFAQKKKNIDLLDKVNVFEILS